jgi:hypothetical protein
MFQLGKSGKVIGTSIPQFLENNSEVAAELWNKLIGKTGEGEKILIGDEAFNVKHLSGGGFLQGKELEKLKDELVKLQPRFNEFYQSLEKDEKAKAKRNSILELVLSLSAQPAKSEKSTMIICRD